jgi:hypothetical protein
MTREERKGKGAGTSKIEEETGDKDVENRHDGRAAGEGGRKKNIVELENVTSI